MFDMFQRRAQRDSAHVALGAAIAAVGIGLFGTGFAVGSYGAYVTYLIDHGVSPEAAGFGMTLFLLGQVLVVLPADRLTRRISLQYVAVLGLSLSAFGAILVGVGTLESALVSRSLLGLGQGITFIAGMKYVGRTASRSATATAQGLLGAAFTLGFAVGLAASPTAIGQYGTFAPAIFGALVLVVGSVATARLDVLIDDTRASPQTYLDPLTSPVGVALGLGNMAAFGFLMVAATWYTDVLARFTLLPVTATLVGFAMATVAGRAIGGWLSRRIGEQRTVEFSLLGLASLLFVVTYALIAGKPTVLAIALIATGFGFGVPFGPLFSLAFSELSDDPGAILVTMLGMGNLGALAFPWFVGRLLAQTDSYVAGFGILGVVVVLVWLVWRAALPTTGALQQTDVF